MVKTMMHRTDYKVIMNLLRLINRMRPNERRYSFKRLSERAISEAVAKGHLCYVYQCVTEGAEYDGRLKTIYLDDKCVHGLKSCLRYLEVLDCTCLIPRGENSGRTPKVEASELLAGMILYLIKSWVNFDVSNFKIFGHSSLVGTRLTKVNYLIYDKGPDNSQIQFKVSWMIKKSNHHNKLDISNNNTIVGKVVSNVDHKSDAVSDTREVKRTKCHDYGRGGR